MLFTNCTPASYPKYKEAMIRSQRSYLETLVDMTNGDISDMIIISGITRQHLHRVLAAHGLLDRAHSNRDSVHKVRRPSHAGYSKRG